MTFNVRTADLRAINSLTKYPSIPTYHTLDPKNGGLLDEVTQFTGTVIGTEKIDGTNARIILLPDGTYLIGSRENLLYAQGDLIGDPAQGIVEALRPVADSVVGVGQAQGWVQPDTIYTLYGEVYGGKVTGASKQYTASRQVGFRLFDISAVDCIDKRMEWPRERIAAWRDNGGQDFDAEDLLRIVAGSMGLELTPRLFTFDASNLPTTIEDTASWLRLDFPYTRAALDGDAGKAEGIVLRTPDRRIIAKARHEDYARTLRRLAKTSH